jgi:hypothetical protein
VLSAQLIRFLQSDRSRHVCFFFCDFQATSFDIYGHILKHFCAQMQRLLPEAASYIYDEGLRKRKPPTAETLSAILSQLFIQVDDMRLVVDGLDEVAEGEHRALVKGLLRLVQDQTSARLLLVSQDIPSISRQLPKRARLSMNDERLKEAVSKDIALIVGSTMDELIDDLVDTSSVIIGREEREALVAAISNKAEGNQSLILCLPKSILTADEV